MVSAAVTIPVNITELALIQCRMIAGIAHLRGYDLADPRVRNAILATMMGEDTVEDLVKQKRLPARPMALATATEIYPDLDRLIANEVASDLIKRVAGKRTGRRRGPPGAHRRRHGRRGRRRVRDLAARPLRRPRAAAPHPSVDRHHGRDRTRPVSSRRTTRWRSRYDGRR